jgi:multiple sugar transport system permease protein
MDGCGAFGIYWHVVLPLVRQTFLLLAIFILVATGGFLLARPSVTLHAGTRSSDFPFLIAASVATTLPLIAIFFLARQFFPARKFSDPL